MLTNAVAPDKLGGLERYVRELAAELVRSGVNVRILAKQVGPADPLEEIGEDGVRVQRYSLGRRTSPLFAPAYPLRTADAVRSARRRCPGDAVVHAHFPVPALPLALAKVPYLYTFHAPVYRELLSERNGSYPLAPAFQQAAVGGLRRTERLVVGRAARLVVLSEYMRSELDLLGMVAAARATLIPGGVDTTRFAPGVADRDGWSAEADPLLFTARRLTPRTGVLELLRAMPIILRSLPLARLAIAGTGRAEPELRREAARLALDESVRFLGAITDAELVNRYRSSELVVMPSQELEGFGLTTAEALACGTPVVGTPVGATPELLAGIDPALVAADATPEGIAAAVLDLLADTRRLSAIRQTLAEATAEALSWPAVAARYLEEYRALSEAPRR